MIIALTTPKKLLVKLILLDMGDLSITISVMLLEVINLCHQ